MSSFGGFGGGAPQGMGGPPPEEQELQGAFSIAKQEAGMGEEGVPGPMELEDLLGPSVGLNEGDEYSQDAYDDAMADMGDEYGEVMDMGGGPDQAQQAPGEQSEFQETVQADMKDLLSLKAQERLAASEQYQQTAKEDAYSHKKGY